MTDTTVTFTAPRQVELAETPVPAPGPGQIVTETLASLISTGTELTAYSGDFPPNSVWSGYIQYPWQAGYSNVGQVVDVGEGVTNLRPGDRVMSQAHHTTRACVALSSVVAVPDGVSDEEATFLELGCTVMNGVRLAQIELGESVVVIGAGLLGQLAASLVALSGAWPVIVVDTAEKRLRLAQRRGANHVVQADAAEARGAIDEILGGRGADVVFEVTGNPQVIPGALRLPRRRGRVILLGSPRGPSTVDFHDEVHTLGLQVIGAHTTTQPEHETQYTPWTRARNAALFLDLVAAHRLRVDDLISHRYSYTDAAEAYDFLFRDRTRAMGVIFTYP